MLYQGKDITVHSLLLYNDILQGIRFRIQPITEEAKNGFEVIKTQHTATRPLIKNSIMVNGISYDLDEVDDLYDEDIEEEKGTNFVDGTNSTTDKVYYKDVEITTLYKDIQPYILEQYPKEELLDTGDMLLTYEEYENPDLIVIDSTDEIGFKGTVLTLLQLESPYSLTTRIDNKVVRKSALIRVLLENIKTKETVPYNVWGIAIEEAIKEVKEYVINTTNCRINDIRTIKTSIIVNEPLYYHMKLGVDKAIKE